ncbi:2Fe-2S iron-sulfur cluster-binding protein [Methylocystis echinoides]|jgi:2Fe-2S ferredoxin|uniref:2Fe-2S iron-sulfur cluster-binding protein n=1 Tax=Methylocystis echinoides TaxID=29468 RepID=UPI0024929846|nr:2Fe-2S iron-sulfur cluster-binding protein [Methylocystis echinoides]
MSSTLDIVDTSLSPLEPETPFLRVEDRNGVFHELAAVEGWRLMEILRDYGMGMDNTCGGALACAECHVVLDAESAARVPPPREDELEKLDELPMLYDNSRLSCQIIWSDDMSGLALKLPQEV